MNDPGQPSWLGAVRAHLDESTDLLDAATLSRLNQARNAALAQPRARGLRTWSLSAAGVAASCALVFAVVAWYPPRQAVAPVRPAPADAELAVDDGIEFYQDLEFYAWLDAQEQDNGG